MSVASRRLAIGLALAATFAAFVALELVRPFAVGPVGFDSAASVIHFDRIAAGRHLEAFITATPKPLLTLVYGSLHGLTHDWRPISWAVIGAYAAGTALAGWLAGRTAGLAAGAFAVAALLASRTMLTDVSIAYAVPWALVGWMVAGLALTGERRRFVVAGIALAVAATARLETLAVVGVAAGSIALAWLLYRAGRLERPPDRRWWLVPLLGLVALPVMLVHDWLLTGDPLFWMSVSVRYSEAAPGSVLTPLELLDLLVRRLAGMALFSALALVGTGWLLRRRSWIALVGLAGLGPGVAAFLLVLASRGTYVSPRYLAAVDVAVLLAAAVGVGAVAGWLLARRRERIPDGRRATVLTVVGVVAVAAIASWPIPSLDAPFRSAARAPRLQAERDARAEPVLACALDGIPGAREFPPADEADPYSTATRSLVMLVAGLERPRLSVDLGVPLDKIGGTPPAWVEPGEGFLPYGRLVFHDRRADRDDDAFAALEVDEPTSYGTTTLLPLLADETDGIWVLRIDRADGESGGPDCASAAAGSRSNAAAGSRSSAAAPVRSTDIAPSRSSATELSSSVHGRRRA